MGSPQRLQKILSRAGIASRRHAEELIAAGRVTVNDLVATLGSSADPDRDRIAVDGAPISFPERVCIALHKPSGYVTTVRDDRGRRTVMALVPAMPGLHPVGRLDYGTEGLLLLTNDGALTLAITHPRHEIAKTYLATVVGVPDAAALRALAEGVGLADGLTAPARARVESTVPGGAVVSLELHEGRNRQVRRMLEAVGHPVRRLIRTAVGEIRLGDLQPGQWRTLTPDEVEWLSKSVPRSTE
ncbi:MAG: rRNA pseudouridine synthase [Candidatus Sericytochromatia bacterium]|nr:rRNA pseudouridine synthase [Candidatus Tanganyikabacteria bacterium]